MGNTWITSDLHFNHDKPFIWQARGYNSVEEMNEIQIQKYNSLVQDNDEVYILGDLMMGKYDFGINCLNRLKGNIHVILGNHDTDNRRKIYEEVFGWNCQYADILRIGKYRFFLCHYPTDTANFENKKMSLALINLHGHVHINKAIEDNPFCYNVVLDAHNGYPVEIEQILSDIKGEI